MTFVGLGSGDIISDPRNQDELQYLMSTVNHIADQVSPLAFKAAELKDKMSGFTPKNTQAGKTGMFVLGLLLVLFYISNLNCFFSSSLYLFIYLL
jgi:hypothetical protein